MKNRMILLLAALTLTSNASAHVRVFVTPASNGMGLDIPANAFQPTFSTVDQQDNNYNAYDFYYGHFTVTNYPTLDTPAGTVDDPVEIPADDFAYVWVRFESEPKRANIHAFDVKVSEVGSVNPALIDVAWYLQNDKDNPTSGMSRKRWDGMATPPDYPEWHTNPQAFLALQGAGITNLASGIDAQMMGKWLAGTDTEPRSSVHLLGAVKGAPGKKYEVFFPSLFNYSNGTIPDGLGNGVFTFLPEPANLVLLGLAGLVMRRR